MSKIKEEVLNSSLELKSEHLDAMHLINKFMRVCRDTQQTPKRFENLCMICTITQENMVFDIVLSETFVYL